MNKYEFFTNELSEMARIRHDERLILSYEEQTEIYTQMLEGRRFFEAAHFGDIFDKDSETYPVAIQLSFTLDVEDFDISTAVISAKYSTEARHRKHRKSRRMAKVNRRKDSRWVAYLDGTAKECKHKNHRAVRREYDIPVGKSNFSHKVGSYLYFW